jgi:cardiolipin-specific phospholipase
MGSAPSALVRAEDDILRAGVEWYSGLPGKKPEAKVTFAATDTPIGPGLHIHTVEYGLESVSKAADALPLVCMHGFAWGLGAYYTALPGLAERWPGKVYAIDSLGCGLSSRPRWHLGHGIECRVEEAEAFFVDGLEAWRVAMRIEKMVLMGHSLGGYVAIAYAERYAEASESPCACLHACIDQMASDGVPNWSPHSPEYAHLPLRYPERVERLVLVSSVGTPAPPDDLELIHARAPLFVRAALRAWRQGWSPFMVAKLGLANTVLGRYVSR